MQSQLENLGIAVYLLVFRVNGPEPVILPRYSGSTFHGLLGNVLQKVRYGDKPKCSACPIASYCRYMDVASYFFRAPADHPFLVDNYAQLRQIYPDRALNNQRDLIAPFCIHPPAGGRFQQDELISMPMLLVGRAIELFPFLVCALERVGSCHVGVNRKARMDLAAIYALDISGEADPALLYDPGRGLLPEPSLVFDFAYATWSAEAVGGELPENFEVSMRFLTPVKLYKQQRDRDKRLFNTAPSFGEVFADLLRRFIFLSAHSMMEQPFARQELLAAAEAIRVHGDELSPARIRRKGGTDLVGALGELSFSGPLRPFLPFLLWGEYLHLGKLPTKGFGIYRLSVDGLMGYDDL